MTSAIDLSRRVVLAGVGAALLPNDAAHAATPADGKDASGEQPRTTTMNIMRSGSQPSTKGSAEYFTGPVRIDMPFRASAPARLGGAIVTFEPGSRTAWHTHPLGQTLIVTSGLGWVQSQGGPKEEIQSRRYRLDSAGREALAWRNSSHCHGARRDLRGARWQNSGLDGEGDRHAVRWLGSLFDDKSAREGVPRLVRAVELGTVPRFDVGSLVAVNAEA